MAQRTDMTNYEAAASKRLLVSVVIIVAVIPLLIAAGYKLIGDKMYMPVSIIMLVLVMAPFFMVFENRKPKAREIMLIVVMSALTVLTHGIFHIIFPVQIGTAMVIISGISLGPEAGFLIGAMSRLISNFYMGQGPWTPWQMFSWGILGFLAGFIFNKGNQEEKHSRSFKLMLGPLVSTIFMLLVGYVLYLFFPGDDDTFLGWRIYVFGGIGLVLGLVMQKNKLPTDNITMSIVTFLMTVIIYGGIINISSVINSTNLAGGHHMSIEGIKLLYVSGLPFDVAHGATAAVCVFLIGDSIISKLERIKIKYGIYRG